MRRHPWEKADSTAPYRSRSSMSLLITWRIRHDPASGAKVRPVRRARWIWAANPTVKASTRRLGSDTDTSPAPQSMVEATTSWIPLKSAVDSEVSATSS